MAQGKQILVSFNHGVAIMLDGRAIIVGCAICEEIFQAETVVVPKKEKTAKPTPQEVIEQGTKLTLDFPMFLRVLSLADGKLLSKPVEILVKWNNISAICNL